MKTSKGKRHERQSHRQASHDKEHSAGESGERISAGNESSSHESKKISQGNSMAVPGKTYLVFSVAVMVVLIGVIVYLVSRNSGGLSPSPSTGANNLGAYSGDKATVEFYVMSQCPYGTQVEDAFLPVMKKMGNAIDWQVNYIVRESSPGVFQSLHGDKEVQGNLAQLCMNKHYPDKFTGFLECQNKDPANVDANWASCASNLGLDASKISACIKSAEGTTLLRESMLKSNARQATGSPTMFINGVPYNGGRQTADFQREVCKYIGHPECANIPKCSSDADCTGQAGKEGTCSNPGTIQAACSYKDPVEFALIVLNDAKCNSCDSTNIVQVSRQLFLGVQPRVVDISSPEGKALVQKNNVELLPAYFFDSKVADTKSWSSVEGLQSAFEQMSDGSYKLRDEVTGAAYFVSEEARAAYQAEQDRQNAEKLQAVGVVKNDNKPQIDFFVMSYCPYGNQAEEGIEPVYQLLKDKAIFNPRYIISESSPGVFQSLHGVQELNQDLRELCVKKHLGINDWFRFALAMNKQCSSQNADSCWEGVAKALNLDADKIQACYSNERDSLLSAEASLTQKLGVQGSPTVFVDGIPYNGGRSPEAYKTSLCSAFDSAPGDCSTKLAGEATESSGSATAAGCGI